MAHPANQNICFTISDLARLLRKVYDRRVSKLGITRSQWSVLVQLKRSEGITQCELAELVEIEHPSLVRHLDKLEECDLVMRKGDQADRRVKRVFLTPKCAAVLEKLEQEGAILRAESLHGLNAQEQQSLVELLSKIKGNLLELQEDETCKSVA